LSRFKDGEMMTGENSVIYQKKFEDGWTDISYDEFAQDAFSESESTGTEN